MLDEIEKRAKMVPGVGKYESTAYDEQRLKPARGVFRVKEQKITTAEEMINIGQSQPIIFYEPVQMVSPNFEL